MNWQFSDSSTLVNIHNGFTVFLIKGSWKHIEDMVPLAPEGMGFLRQAQLLREGVEYAEAYIQPYALLDGGVTCSGRAA